MEESQWDSSAISSREVGGGAKVEFDVSDSGRSSATTPLGAVGAPAAEGPVPSARSSIYEWSPQEVGNFLDSLEFADFDSKVITVRSASLPTLCTAHRSFPLC